MIKNKLSHFKVCVLASVITGIYGCSGGDNLDYPNYSISMSDAQVVDEGESVTVSGSASVDSPTYSWVQTGGPAVTLGSTNSESLSFTVPRVSKDTRLWFRLSAESNGTVVVGHTYVDIKNIPLAPSAEAGENFSVEENTNTVSLNGSASVDYEDQPSDNFEYSWRQVSGPGVELSSTTVANPSFTAPDVAENTELTFALTVSNSEGESTEDTVVVNITTLSPTAVAGETIVVTEGESFTLDGSGSQSIGDNPLTTYTWRAIENTVTIDNSDPSSPTRNNLVAPRVDSGDSVELQFGLTVSDGENTSAEDIVTVRVNNGGVVPVASASNVEGAQNSVIVIDAAGSSDAGGRGLSYMWQQVLADGEDGVSITATGSQIEFTAPEVSEDTELTFTLSVDNGINTSAPVTVTALIKAVSSSGAYNGKYVKLERNPFTTLYDSLDLSAHGELYDMIVDGDLAYITYHDRTKEEQPTGLLVVDISDEKQLKVSKNYPLTFYGNEGKINAQLHLALDTANSFAYIVDHSLVDTNEPITSLARINLAAEPAADGSHVERYADIELDGDNIGRVSDLELYNGALYLAAADDRAILKLDLSSSPQNPALSYIWKDDPSSDLDVSVKAEFRNRSKYQGTPYERLELVPDGEGTKAVLYNGSAMQVVRWGADEAVTEFYNVRSRGTEVDPDAVLDFRGFKGVEDRNNKPSISFSIAEDGNSVFVSFAEDSEMGSPLRPFSALEKIDIRSPQEVDVDTAGTYFQTTEDAFEVVRTPGLTYLAGGIQGLQLIEDIAATDTTAASMAVKTYYQTPQRAEDIVIATNTANLPRAYVIGDNIFTIVDLDPTQQSAPHTSTNWVQEYVEGTVVRTDKSGSGHEADGNKRGQASDVEIVAQYNEEGVVVKEFAVVAESADPDSESAATSENKLIIFDIENTAFSGKEILLGAIDTDYGGDENQEDIRLHQSYGDIYLFDPSIPSTTMANLRLDNSQVAADAPSLQTADFGYHVTGFAFFEADRMVVSGNNYTEHWAWDDASGGLTNPGIDEIWNNQFYSNMYLNDTATYLLGSGDFDEGNGCGLFALTDYKGNPSSGSTAPKMVYDLVDYERVENEFERSLFFSGTSDVEREICFGGFGFNQNSSFDEVDADNELGGEFKPAYGIQIVDFNTKISSIIPTQPGLNGDDPFSDTDHDPTDFASVYIYDLPDNPEDIHRVGNRLYVATNTFGGIQILDATNPANVVLEGIIHTEDKAKGVAVNHDQTLAIIADDNIRGIVRSPLSFPSLDRVDNDDVTNAIDGEGLPVMSNEEVIAADQKAIAGSVLRYEVLGMQTNDDVICYASEDSLPHGDESCLVEESEGRTYVNWTLSNNADEAGNVVDQQIRIAVGDNIQFLSTSAQVQIEEDAND